MASLTNDLECLNLNKKRELGAIPKSASVGCVPGTPSNNAPSTPSSVAKNRRNRRNKQRSKQVQLATSNYTLQTSSSSSNPPHLLQQSPSDSGISSKLNEDRRVPEIPEIPELLPLPKHNSLSKICETSDVEEGRSVNGQNKNKLESGPEHVDSPKATNRKNSSRKNRRIAAGKRKKPTEDIPLLTEKNKDRGKGVENKENSKAFNEDFPHIDESDLGMLW